MKKKCQRKINFPQHKIQCGIKNMILQICASIRNSLPVLMNS